MGTFAETAQHDIRSFDVASYKSAIVDHRRERFNTLYSADFLPSPSGAGSCNTIAVACSNGQVRAYHTQDLKQRWISGQQSGQPCHTWSAHSGAVYCLARVETGGLQGGSGALLITGGEDGRVRGWRMDQVVPEHASSDTGSTSITGAPQPVLDVQVPRASSSLGSVSLGSSAPAVLSLCFDGQDTLYAGASDGGCHAIDLHTGSCSTMTGHAAAVHCLDYCPAIHSMASGSEDGTVRLWDLRASSSSSTSVINPWGGLLVEDTPAACLACVRSSHVPCLRFESSGSWLVIGNGASALTVWGMTMGSLAKHISTSCVPQAIHLLPGAIMVVGNEPYISTYRFSGDTPTKQHVSVRSAYGLAVAPDSGEVAISGIGGSLELLSQYGRKLGALYYTSMEE